MLNDDKESKAKATAEKKVEEARENTKKKTGKDVDEFNNWNELISGFE